MHEGIEDATNPEMAEDQNMINCIQQYREILVHG